MENISGLGKKAKIMIIAAVCLTVFVAAVGLITYFSGKNYDDTYIGNTHSNIANGGLAVYTEDGTTYFISEKLFRLDPDGTCTRLTDYKVTGLVLSEGYLYFINHEDSQKIYRMNLDTLEAEVVSDIPGTSINVVGSTLYYASLYGPDYTGIYRVDLSAAEFQPELISADWADCLLYYNSRLYFVNAADIKKVYSIALDGSDRRVSVGRGTGRITFYEGWMYYCGVYGIYKCKPDGSSRVQLSEMRASVINVFDGHIYYCFLSSGSTEANQELYRMTTDGKELEMITKDSASALCIAGDYMYFENVYKEYGLYRISLDNKIFENMDNKYKLK